MMDESPEAALGLPTRPSSDDTRVVRMLVALERPPVSDEPSMPEEPVLDEPVPVLDEPVPVLDEPVPVLEEPVPVLDVPVVVPVAPSEKKNKVSNHRHNTKGVALTDNGQDGSQLPTLLSLGSR